MLCKRGLCRHAVSVRLSVCPSVTFVNPVKTSNRIFHFFTSGHSSFSILNVMAIFRWGPPNGGVECRWGRHKSRFWTNSWLSIDDCCSVRSTIVFRAHSALVYNSTVHVCLRHRSPRISLRRTEQNGTAFICTQR